MTRSAKVTRFGDWLLREDTGPDIDPPAYLMVCKSEDEDGAPCGKDSGEVNSFAESTEWTRKHGWAHPDHRSFRLLADVPMVIVPEVEPL
ncbi:MULTISPECIES: hypothetical protein [unclassified Kitasatospora]|uniref:DUF7848 domain-containing protein n=1 Tax=unclassified Kitasatospora TaxID=2633591 RepID=UPI00382B2501